MRVSKRAMFGKAVACIGLISSAAALSAQQARPKSDGVSTVQERKVSSDNLKRLALAMHLHHDQYGQFPPASVFAKDGKALLSWRVLTLPFVDEEGLFREFKLDQPWDSPHNKKLLPRMPAVYAAPKVKTKQPHSTFYQVFTGKGTIFEGMRGGRIHDILDGTANTILIIEGAEAVPWTKPADLTYDAKKPLPRLGGIFPDGFNFACADGHVQFCKKRFRESVMRLLITCADGETIPDNLDD